MGRYYRHPVAPIIDYSYKLPFNELFQAMQMKEQKQAQAISALNQSEQQTENAFTAASGLKHDIALRDQKMEAFNKYVDKMSTRDLTKMDNINDINNYISDFAKDKDVKAISQRAADYNAKLEELAESRKKHGKVLDSERYWFDDSIKRYNASDGYMREFTLGSVQGHYDYMKDLVKIGELVKPDVISRMREDGKYYYQVKNTTVSRAKLQNAIASALPEGARQALQHDWQIDRDRILQSGEEMPEYMENFYDYVKVKASLAGEPFVRNDQEVTGRGVNPDYTAALKKREDAQFTSMIQAPPTKVNDNSIKQTFDDKRVAQNNLRKVNEQIAKTEFGKTKNIKGEPNNISNVEDVEAYLLQHPEQGELIMGLQQAQHQLDSEINNSQTYLNQVNTSFITNDSSVANPLGFGPSISGKDWWKQQYAALENVVDMPKNAKGEKVLSWTDDDGKKRTAIINNSEDLRNLLVDGKTNLAEDFSKWERLNPFGEHGYFGSGQAGKSTIGHPFTIEGEGGGEKDARVMLEEVMSAVMEQYQDYAEAEDIEENLMIIRGVKGSREEKARESVQNLVQEGAGQFFSTVDGTDLRDVLQNNMTGAADEVRKRTHVNITDGVGKNGLPIVWITAFSADGKERVIDQGFEMQTMDDSFLDFTADVVKDSGYANDNPNFVRAGERIQARHINAAMRKTNLWQSNETVNLVNASTTKEQIPDGDGGFIDGNKYIQRTIPGYPGAALKVTALTGTPTYSLMTYNENKDKWEVLRHRELNAKGELETNANLLKPVKATSIATLSWLWWKYLPQNGGNRAIFNPTSNQFRYLPEEKK